MELFEAIDRGDLEGVRQEIAEGADLDARNEHEMTPLLHASAEGHLEIVRMLLDAGAAIDAVSDDAGQGGTALQAANYTNQQDVALFLLERGADPELRGGEYEEPPLRLALDQNNFRLARALVDRGVALEWKDDDGELETTALHGAVFSEEADPALVAAIIAKGVGIDTFDPSGETPLCVACSAGAPVEVVRTLLDHGASIAAAGEDASPPLVLAVLGGHTSLVEFLLERGASATTPHGGQTPFQMAVAQDDLETALAVARHAGIDADADPAIASLRAIDAARRGATAELASLLDRGVAVDTRSHGAAGTLLHGAVEHPSVVRLLLERGAEADSVDENRRTPLILAVQQGARESALALLERGADPRRRDEYDDDAILTATEDEIDPEMLALLLSRGADPMSRTGDGESPLSRAAMAANPRAVQLLIEAGASAVPDKKRRPVVHPLHQAFEMEDAEEDDVLEVCRLLVEAGADVNAKNSDRRTAAHLAVLGGRPRVLEFLVSRGADAFARGSRNRTPLDELADAGLDEADETAIRDLLDPERLLG